MPKKQISVEIESSGYDAMVKLGQFVAAVKAAHAGGASLVTAIPADVAAAVADLAPLLGMLPQIGPDAKEDLTELLHGVDEGFWEVKKALFG